MEKENRYIQMTIRLDPAFHASCLASAEEFGQTLAEWIRRAMKDKLAALSARHPASSSPVVAPVFTSAEYDAIRSVIREELEKMEKKEAGDGSL